MDFKDLEVLLSDMRTDERIDVYTSNKSWIGVYEDKFTLTPTLLTIKKEDGTIYNIPNENIISITIHAEHIKRPTEIWK